jgi:hypothetical protein
MKTLNLFIVLSFILMTACEKIEKDAPSCVKDLIRNHKNKTLLCETGASVKQYSFQGDYVYVFDPGNCGADMNAPVYSSNCEYLGGLGGFTGNMLINGVRFDQNSTYVKTIWTN